jgi:pyruvate dehydrogenase E1 component beta subunit
MVGFAERVAEQVAAQGISAEILDLRSVSPLDEMSLLDSVCKTRRIAVFDIAWPRFALAGEIARLVCSHPDLPLRAPLVSVAQPPRHVPASPFLEQHHYPREADAAEQVIRAIRSGRS